MLRELCPRVIVSDVSMPDNGFELIRDVLAFAAETGLTVPAVAITAGRDSGDHVREAGFAGFITKPLDPFMLAVTVERLAKRRGLAQPGRPTPRRVSVMQTLRNGDVRVRAEGRATPLNGARDSEGRRQALLPEPAAFRAGHARRLWLIALGIHT